MAMIGLGLAAADAVMAADSKVLNKQNRLVDEKVQQLETLSNLSALIAGFSMVILVENQIEKDTEEGLVTAFGAFGALSVCLMLTSMIMMALMLIYVLNYRQRHQQPFEAKIWEARCESDWNFAFTSFKLGIVCFLVTLALLGWTKFHHWPSAAYVITAIASVAVIHWFVYVKKKWADILAE
eukprot:Rmarinus@m.8173